ncbi:protein distal antenna-like [Diorhabda carinulata]|uniref:protein distal antenna-like n=1 Tax=Diorhabda carinulata TaxID=1163345 RepID=UPI0025A114FD|nr:protein distal antenna-like [Diorhabda carinulata]
MSGKSSSKRPLRALTAHEKLDAIRRVHDGESKASVARDIGVPESTLRGWCKNEDKISYLSRQSSPETDESLDRSTLNKKPKLDESFNQPFNLSLRTNNSYTIPTDTKPLNLHNNTKSNVAESTLKSTNHVSERERNRAELARLSVELGLNRPEMFMPNNTNNLSLLSDLSTNISLITQWNSILTQQQMKAQQQPPNKIDTTNAVSSSNNLLTTVDQNNCQLPKDVQSVQDSVWYWLSSQQMLNNMNNSVPTSSVNNQTELTDESSVNNFWEDFGNYPKKGPSLWKWLNQLAYRGLGVNDPILYQQLTKNISPKSAVSIPDQQNAENLSLKDEKQKLLEKASNNKVRAVLDNILLNNNITVTENKRSKDEDLDKQREALLHGEKFLKWLESCSDPTVTAVQIMQFRLLLNNVKNGVDRKNSDTQNKTKVKRK